MRMSKANKERALNLRAGVIDCNYMLKRLEAENASQSEIDNWLQYKKDILAVLAKIEAK